VISFWIVEWRISWIWVMVLCCFYAKLALRDATRAMRRKIGGCGGYLVMANKKN